MNRCHHCGSTLHPELPACHYCGATQNAELGRVQGECELHNGIAAKALCVVCARPLCGDCAVMECGKFFCDDRDHRQVDKEMIPLMWCESEFEVDLILRNLQSHQFPVRWFSPSHHVENFWQRVRMPIALWIAKDRRSEAERVLAGLGLLEASNDRKHLAGDSSL